MLMVQLLGSAVNEVLELVTGLPDVPDKAGHGHLTAKTGGFEDEAPEPLEANVANEVRGAPAVTPKLFVIEGATFAYVDAMACTVGQIFANRFLERESHADEN